MNKVANMEFHLGWYEDALLDYIEAEEGQKKALWRKIMGLVWHLALEFKGNYNDALAKFRNYGHWLGVRSIDPNK